MALSFAKKLLSSGWRKAGKNANGTQLYSKGGEKLTASGVRGRMNGAKARGSGTRTFKVKGQNRTFSRKPGSPMTAKDKKEINAAFKQAEKGRRKRTAKAAKRGGADAVKKRAAAEARSQRQVLRKEVSRLKSLSAKRNKAKTAKSRKSLDEKLKTLSTRMKKREDRINALLATAGQR